MGGYRDIMILMG